MAISVRLAHFVFVVLAGVCLSSAIVHRDRTGILYPRETESREIKCLDGIWNFRIAPRLQPDLGFTHGWFRKSLDKTGDVESMPVPSSFNDITQKKEIRDHVGWAWYDRTFFLPPAWKTGKRIFIRIGAAHYHAVVYVNGYEIVKHDGGALSFQAELSTKILKFEAANIVTIAINNTLTPDTLPQGTVKWFDDPSIPPGYFTLETNFDYFLYAGIHRSVILYTTPRTYVEDIDVTTWVDQTTGYIDYEIKTWDMVGNTQAGIVKIELEDKHGVVVVSSIGHTGEMTVPNAKFWWPYTMVEDDREAGYLYTFVVTLTDTVTKERDVYRLKVGIRSISWTQRGFFINRQPFYFRGLGRHEDSDIRGKGLDNAIIVKDHNLLKWFGANSYRTSHYPYAEEQLDLADKLGIVVVNESPANEMSGYGDKLLENHKEMYRQMIQRDKNRACVVMWSIGNEPDTSESGAGPYIREMADFIRQLDRWRRPVTMPTYEEFDADVAAKYVDIISINPYLFRYTDVGRNELIRKAVILNVENWARYHKKPIIYMEYGSNAVAGLHRNPAFVWTEDNQKELMIEYYKAFDQLRTNASLVGEMIWSFADFMTKQDSARVDGNKQGILTRERQPKASAHLLRYRYFLLAQQTDGYPLPDGLSDAIPIFGFETHRKPSPSEN